MKSLTLSIMNRKLRLLFLLLALMLTGSSFASTLYYVVDDIRYAANTVDNTAQVVSYGSYKSMTEINIPASITADGVSYKVTSLGDSCFKGCTSLTSVKIPASVTALGDSCFNDCTSLESITIPASVTKLGWCCFKGCTGLTSITIPNSVTWLGWYCFEGCTSLTSVNIGNSVTELGDGCFSGCTGLESLTIPNSVTELGGWCFENCSSLTSITIPNSVTELPSVCFYGCTSLTSITIPNSVTELGNSCFYGCTSLASVNIPSSVTSLGGRCFENCASLTSITIPNSVTELGKACFYGCTSLTRVYCLGTTPPSCNDYYTFENKASKTLYVPEESVDAYKSAMVWKDFGKIRPINTTGIKAVDMDKIDIAVEDGTIKLSNVPTNEPVSVYSTSGELLGSGKGNITVSALSGQTIIVKVGTRSRKVLVK